jgi:hypothetical protein
MGAGAVAAQATARERGFHGMGDDLRRERRVDWRAVADEHGPTAIRRSPMLQVLSNRLPGQHGQRQDVDPPGLPGTNPNRTLLPIQIVELEVGNFTRTQTQVQHAARHRVPALPVRVVPIKLILDSLSPRFEADARNS